MDNNGAVYRALRNWNKLIEERRSFDINTYNQMVIDGIYKINYIAELIKNNPDCGINKNSFYTLKNTYIHFLYVLSIYNSYMYKFIPIGINHTKYGNVYYIKICINNTECIVSTKYTDDWYSIYLTDIFNKNVSYDEYIDNVTYTVDNSVNAYNEYQNLITWFCKHNWFHLSQVSGNQQFITLKHILKDTKYSICLNPGDNMHKLTSYYTAIYGFYYNFDDSCIYYTRTRITDVRYIFNESYIKSCYSKEFWWLREEPLRWGAYKCYPIIAENIKNILPEYMAPTNIRDAIFAISKHIRKNERMNK